MKKFNLALLVLPLATFFTCQTANANNDNDPIILKNQSKHFSVMKHHKNKQQVCSENNGTTCGNIKQSEENQKTVNDNEKKQHKISKTEKDEKKEGNKEELFFKNVKNFNNYIMKDGMLNPRIGFKDLNKLSISTVGKKEVQENYLTVELSTKKQNKDPKLLEQELINDVNSATSSLKNLIDNNANIKISTGNFNIFPKYDETSSQISIWEGRGSLIIEGKDINEIKNSISKLKSNLIVSDIRMSVASSDIAKYKEDVVNTAIENFKHEAMIYSKSFGFDNYMIQNVEINYNNYPITMMRNVLAVRNMSESTDEELPSKTLEIMPNKVELQATINGTVIMKPNYIK